MSDMVQDAPPQGESSKGMSVGKVSKHTAIYGVGTLIRHLTALVMLPIYTRYLVPADYGAVELLTMALEITGILMGLRITQAMFRFYILEHHLEKKNLVVSTVLLTALSMSLLAMLVLQLLSKEIVILLFGNLDFLNEFRLFALTLIPTAITATGMVYLQALQKPMLYVVISVLTLVVQVVGNIYFVVIEELHVLGVVYSALFSGFLNSLLLGGFIVFNAGLRFDIQLCRRLVKFVYPLIIASLAGFYVAYADKYLLRVFDGLAAVGLYVLAARISSAIGSVYGAFNQSWSAARFEVYKQSNSRDIFNQVFKVAGVGLVIIGSGVAILSIDLIYYMTDTEYHSATGLMPLFVVSAILSAGVPFFNFGILLREKTSNMAHAAWIKVIVSTLFYIWLIPVLGVYGAAIGLVISGLFEVVYVYFKAKSLYNMRLNFKPIIYSLIIASVFVALGFMWPAGGFLDTVFRVFLFFTMVFVIYVSPALTIKDRLELKKVIFSLRARRV